MSKSIILPPLPPIPVTPMSGDEKKKLAKILAIDKSKDLWRPEVQEYVKQGYIRIWLSICLDSRVSPPFAASPSASGFQAVLPRFLRAVDAIGLHTREQVAEWHVNRIAAEASAAWQEATTRPQARVSEHPARPAYVQALAGGA